MSGSILAAGKTKTVSSTANESEVLLTFRDDITAGDGKKHDVLAGKGKVNATISAKLFTRLEEGGIPTHLVKQVDDEKLLVKRLKMIPVEVVCRIRAAGHFIGIGLGYQDGERLPFPLVEFYLKDDARHDPLLTDAHLELLKLANRDEIKQIKDMTTRAAWILEKFFDGKGATLVDFKLEFGRDRDGNLVVGDELSPDSWRLWDKETREILDKDRFRKGLPKVFELGYQEPLRRISADPVLHR